VRTNRDRIEVDGKRVGEAEKIYLMMNKPRGIVTTASDEKGRETVYNLLPQGLPWIAPVGRLDQASEGLLLFTNDTEWSARVTAPETHLDKTYHVQVATVADNSVLAALERGVTENNDVLRAKRTRKLREGEKNSWIEIILDEGKNRQIRRMFQGLGIEVTRLVRVAIGPLELGSLEKGRTRRILAEEKEALDVAMD
jgi:23S rRNA pseudouridine2605 synthase